MNTNPNQVAIIKLVGALELATLLVAAIEAAHVYMVQEEAQLHVQPFTVHDEAFSVEMNSLLTRTGAVLETCHHAEQTLRGIAELVTRMSGSTALDLPTLQSTVRVALANQILEAESEIPPLGFEDFIT